MFHHLRYTVTKVWILNTRIEQKQHNFLPTNISISPATDV